LTPFLLGARLHDLEAAIDHFEHIIQPWSGRLLHRQVYRDHVSGAHVTQQGRRNLHGYSAIHQ
jgi:hypothetical protein